MPGNANSGQGNGTEHRDALLSLLEVHTEGATATELASYVDRAANSTRAQLLALQEQGRVSQSSDKLWHLTPQEAEHRSALLTPALKLPPPVRTRSRGR